jgi:hypothetical protein
MKMEEIDMAVPTSSNIDDITNYYRNNLKNIIKSASSSSSSSLCDSDVEINDNYKLTKLSEAKVAESDKIPTISETINGAKPPEINISNSSDVHVGNKTFYNAPVTQHITQLMIKEDDLDKYLKNRLQGKINGTFDG